MAIDLDTTENVLLLYRSKTADPSPIISFEHVLPHEIRQNVSLTNEAKDKVFFLSLWPFSHLFLGRVCI